MPLLALLIRWRNCRAGIAALLTAAGVSAGLLFSYLHGREDPTDWIRWSAARVFLSVSVVLVLGAAVCGPDDDGEPCITVMMPDED